jgi:hypothetical protein
VLLTVVGNRRAPAGICTRLNYAALKSRNLEITLARNEAVANFHID